MTRRIEDKLAALEKSKFDPFERLLEYVYWQLFRTRIKLIRRFKFEADEDTRRKWYIAANAVGNGVYLNTSLAYCIDEPDKLCLRETYCNVNTWQCIELEIKTLTREEKDQLADNCFTLWSTGEEHPLARHLVDLGDNYARKLLDLLLGKVMAAILGTQEQTK